MRKKEREGLEARLEQMKKEMEEEKGKAKKSESERDHLRLRLEKVTGENVSMTDELCELKEMCAFLKDELTETVGRNRLLLMMMMT